MVKASEEAAAIHEVGSEVRQRLKEKAPSPKLGSAGSHPPLPQDAQRLLRAASCVLQVRKALGEGGKNATKVGM